MDWVVLRKTQEMHFPPENGWFEKLLLPSQSAAQELSEEWLCQSVSTI
jgi:hypothetical protein